MKNKTRLLTGLFTLLLLACAGANTAKAPVPPDISAGMNELTKGNHRYQQGCYRQALAQYFKAYERFSAADHMPGSAMTLNNIGNVYRAVGDIDSALLFYEEACMSYLDLKNQQGALQALSNKTAALIDANRFEDAEGEFIRAARIALPGSRPFGPLLRNRGVLLFKKGDYAGARDLLNAALQNTDPLNLTEFAVVNFAMGKVLLKTNRPDEALRHFESALAADRSASYYRGIADDLAAIGSVYLHNGDFSQAVGFLKRAVQIYALIGDQPDMEATRNLLVQTARQAGLNIELTEFFVERWARGEASEISCR